MSASDAGGPGSSAGRITRALDHDRRVPTTTGPAWLDTDRRAVEVIAGDRSIAPPGQTASPDHD